MRYVVVLWNRVRQATAYYEVEALTPQNAVTIVCKSELDMDYLDAVGSGKPYSLMGVYVQCM